MLIPWMIETLRPWKLEMGIRCMHAWHPCSMNFSVRTTGREVHKHVAISVEETILVITE
jgi:hypothetical protein